MVSMNGPRKLFQEMVNDNGAQVSSKVVSKRGHQEMSQRMVSNVRACGHRGGGAVCGPNGHMTTDHILLLPIAIESEM